MLDNVQAIECRTEIDAVKDHLRHEGVVDAGALEDNGSVVKEIVGTFHSVSCCIHTRTGETHQ